MVLSAADGTSPSALQSLEKLCRAYWYPLYAYVRRRGHDTEAAKDLTQEFFARFLEKNWLTAADPQKGKFRSFLLSAVQHFLSKENERAHAIKRGGHCSFISWDEQTAEMWYQNEPLSAVTPERIYERRWALTVLERVMAQLSNEYTHAGKPELFGGLEPHLSGEQAHGAYAATAGKLSMTEGAVRVAVHRLRRRYGELLREEIAHTVSSPADLDDELHYLLSVLSG